MGLLLVLLLILVLGVVTGAFSTLGTHLPKGMIVTG